jgi:hypothetical protein
MSSGELTPPVDRFSLIAHGMECSLTTLKDSVAELVGSLEAALREQVNVANLASDLFYCIQFKGPGIAAIAEESGARTPSSDE